MTHPATATVTEDVDERVATHRTLTSEASNLRHEPCSSLDGQVPGSGFPGSRLGSSFLVRSRFPGGSTVPGSLVPSSRFVAGSSGATAILRTRHLEPEPVNKELGTNPEPGSQPGTQNPEPGTVLNTRVPGLGGTKGTVPHTRECRVDSGAVPAGDPMGRQADSGVLAPLAPTP